MFSLLRTPLRSASRLPIYSSRAQFSTTARVLNSAATSQPTEQQTSERSPAEQKIYDKLKKDFEPKLLDVMDISGQFVCYCSCRNAV